MPLSTFDGLFTQSVQTPRISKVAGTVVANAWYTTALLSGQPAAFPLPGSNDVVGSLISGNVGNLIFPPVGTFTGGGELRGVALESTVPLRGRVVDVLYLIDRAPAAAGTTTTFPPTIPLSYPDNELWVWTYGAPTGSLSLEVTYLNQAGVSKSTGTVPLTLTGAAGRMARLPLAAGDRAVTRVDSFTRSGATAGNFAILVLAPIWRGRVPVANGLVRDGIDQTGLTPIRGSAALMLMVNADSTSSGETEASVVYGVTP